MNAGMTGMDRLLFLLGSSCDVHLRCQTGTVRCKFDARHCSHGGHTAQHALPLSNRRDYTEQRNNLKKASVQRLFHLGGSTAERVCDGERTFEDWFRCDFCSRTATLPLPHKLRRCGSVRQTADSMPPCHSRKSFAVPGMNAGMTLLR